MMGRSIKEPEKIMFPLKNIDGDNFEDTNGEIICFSQILSRLEFLENKEINDE